MLHKTLGNNWKVIANKIPGRTAEQVKDKAKKLFKNKQPKIMPNKIPNIKNFKESIAPNYGPGEQINPEIEAIIEQHLGDALEHSNNQNPHCSDRSFNSKQNEHQNVVRSNEFNIFYGNQYNFSNGELFKFMK